VPRYSAVRVGGRRAFRAARSGDESLDMPERQIRAADWETGEISGSRIELSVTVSAGTYVRALARDIGGLLGTGGIATDIRRLRSGWFDIAECSPLTDCRDAMLDMNSAMRGYPEIGIPDSRTRERIIHGNPMESPAEGTVRIVDGEGTLVAVGEGVQGTVRPVCVLEQAP
jgi:tRNA pseudouridine55 synthase